MRRKIDPSLPKSPKCALEILQWMCSRMERCQADARTSLYRWKVDPTEHQAIIDKLVEEKYIDDSRYARAFIGEKLRTHRWGVSKITYALRMKHIDPEIITATLDELVNEDEMSDSLFELLERRAQKELQRDQDRYKVRGKLFRWAASRGFDMGEINNALEKIMKGNNE